MQSRAKGISLSFEFQTFRSLGYREELSKKIKDWREVVMQGKYPLDWIAKKIRIRGSSRVSLMLPSFQEDPFLL